ncbi:hypothetical protein [Bradyrhizobium sp. CCBAU 53421]|uniref:hypothetical protein n=1 Tax=Bradyrhizobium sp. CCBAU 53421 TaxID=1325120 RepID=UPI00188BE036|nr:hypothetical protein [Bradyrhizobium sp. CCBAU 53421]QOZ34426.1 hypothetical protein XH92_24480 [Bradyrhizobium sp. CCBAU 53421]
MAEVRFQYSRQDLLKSLADRRGVNLSMLMRSLADSALAADGFPVAETQYALVVDGDVLMHGDHPVMSYRPTADDRGVWLPIENEDSIPFDPALHWRLKQLPLRVDGERVVRTYPVVAKSQEHA